MKKDISKKQSKKLILFYSLASMFNDIGANIIYPLWPFYITTVLGIDQVFLGLIDGVAEFFIHFSKAFSGLYSDYLKKRKEFIWIGYVMPFIARIGYAFSVTWPFLLISKSFDRFGKIRDPPRDAIVSEITSKNVRGKSFGILELFDKLGGVIGVLILILVLYFVTNVNYYRLFLFSAIFSLISVFIIVFFTKDYVPKFANDVKSKKSKLTTKNIYAWNYIKMNLKIKQFKYFLISACLISLSTFSYSFYLLMIKPILFNYTNFNSTIFTNVIIVSAIGFVMYNFSALLSSYNFGVFSDSFGRKKSILLTNLIYLLSLTIMFFGLTSVSSALSIISLILGFVLYGIYIGALNTVLITYVSEIVDQKYKATGIGLFYLFFGIFALLASLFAGYFASNYGYNYMISFSFVTMIVASLSVMFTIKE